MRATWQLSTGVAHFTLCPMMMMMSNEALNAPATVETVQRLFILTQRMAFRDVRNDAVGWLLLLVVVNASLVTLRCTDGTLHNTRLPHVIK